MRLAAHDGPAGSRALAAGRGSRRTFLVATALIFAASAAGTVLWGASMTSGDMPMPGGWTMSMAWMRMPGQTWPGAAASFVAMWGSMMPAMMLPSLAPRLLQYREALGRAGAAHPSRLTALFGAGYFLVWTVLGVAVFPLGVALGAAEMARPALARAVPIAVGAIVVLAGLLQLTPWKLRHLTCCRAPVPPSLAPGARAALGHGIRHGLHCTACCAGPTAVLLVVGVMDLRVMVAVAAAITFERLAPGGARAARIVGVVVVGAGLALIARAAGPG